MLFPSSNSLMFILCIHFLYFCIWHITVSVKTCTHHNNTRPLSYASLVEYDQWIYFLLIQSTCAKLAQEKMFVCALIFSLLVELGQWVCVLLKKTCLCLNGKMGFNCPGNNCQIKHKWDHNYHNSGWISWNSSEHHVWICFLWIGFNVN